MFKASLHDLRPLGWWHELHLAEKIDMNPYYQRRSNIWSRWKRAHLVDSILNDFDVPKFYVADFTTYRSIKGMNQRNTPYAIIDGKQRFEAIFSYLSNEYPLNGTASIESNKDLQVGGLSFRELQDRFPALAQKLVNFIPVVMSVVSDDKAMIDQMFIRLNSGEALNRAEKRNAFSGPIPLIVRDLTLHPFFQKYIRFSTKRMQEQNLLAKLLMIEHKGAFFDTKANNIDDFYKQADRDTTPVDDDEAIELGPYAETEQQVFATLEKMAKIFHEKDILLSAQGNIPIYYWIVRNGKAKNDFRNFLANFVDRVKKNQALAKENGKVNQELAIYYTAGRTTNDRGSLETRYKILLKEYQKYRDAK